MNDDCTYSTNDEIEPRRIPVVDNSIDSFITLTTDEESGKNVMVVDKREFTEMMNSVGGIECELRNQCDICDYVYGVSFYSEEWHWANNVLSAVKHAIEADDTMVVFK